MADLKALSQALSKSFDADDGDMIVVAEDEKGSIDGSFRVWSHLLTSWSTVIADALREGWGQNEEARELRIRGFSKDAVGGFLSFLYTGTLSVEDGAIAEVVALAEKYQVTPLVGIASSQLVDQVTTENACEELQRAWRLGSAKLENRAMDVIRRHAPLALQRACILEEPLLQKVLSCPQLCIDHFVLAMMLVCWSVDPEAEAVVKSLDLPAIFRKHVQLAALTEKQAAALLTAAKDTALEPVVRRERRLAKRGEYTEDFFGALWERCTGSAQTARVGEKRKRRPFLGYWMTFIPGCPDFGGEGECDNNERYTRLERVACGHKALMLAANQEITWYTPFHSFHLQGLSFTLGSAFAKALGGEPQISVSRTGAEWSLVFDAQHYGQVPSGEVLACRIPEAVRWFRLRARTSGFNASLRLHGIFLTE